MRIGTTVFWFVALHGFSLFKTSRAFHSVPRPKSRRSTTCRILRTDRNFRTNSFIDPSTICKIRGGGGRDGNNGPSSSLCGVIRSAGIVVDSIIPSGIIGSINSFFKYHPFIASFLICKLSLVVQIPLISRCCVVIND